MKTRDSQAAPPFPSDPAEDDAARVRALLEPWRSAPVAVADADTASAERERIVAQLAERIVEFPALRARRARARRLGWLLAAAGAVLVLGGTGAWLRHVVLDSSETEASASELAGTKLLAGRVLTDAAATLSSGAFVGEAAFTTPEESSARVVTEGGVLVEVAPATRARVRSAALARVELMDGSVTLEVPPQRHGSNVRVVTPDATVIVHGTRFTVTYVAGGDTPRTCVRVDHGKVSVARSSLDAAGRPESELLTAGQSSGCDAAEPTQATADVATDAVPRFSPRPSASQGSTLAQENRLLQEALAAEQAGDTKRAQARLRTLLTKYPRSGFAAEAERALERIEKERKRR